MSGLFGGAKQKAVQVAHKAVNRAKTHAIQAIKTGDVKGEAMKMFSATKKDALGDARSEIARLKREAREMATLRITQAHSRFQSQLPAYAPRPQYGRSQQRYGPPQRRSSVHRSAIGEKTVHKHVR